MFLLDIYPESLTVSFRQRLNRFVGEFQYRDSIVKAYLPNTGRMAEFLIPDREFFLIKKPTPKFDYRLIATRYQNSFVFLDTSQMNFIFKQLLQHQKILQFQKLQKIKQEVNYADSRFDIELIKQDGKKVVIELKSCTLCHNGVAMFPDAITKRGKKHIIGLSKLVEKRIEAHLYFLVLNGNCTSFVPNLHTDPAYAEEFQSHKNIHYHALKIPFATPHQFDLDEVTEIPIRDNLLSDNLQDKGSYILLLKNPRKFSSKIRQLGMRNFPAGFYIYVGSALNGLSMRLQRHKRKNKKKHWHIDHIFPKRLKLHKEISFRRKDRIEEALANDFSQISEDEIAGFGASDSRMKSHLFYFANDPYHKQNFWNIILKYQTFTEN